MSTLALVIASGIAMSALALVGSVTIGLPEATLARVTPALVGLAAGSLLGGVFFHMLPEAVGYLILLADGLHNLIGGFAVGASIIVDHRVGLGTWAVAAAHETPDPPADRAPRAKDKVLHSTAFFTGGAILLAVAVVAG